MSTRAGLQPKSSLVGLLLILLLLVVAWSLYQGWGRWSDAQIDFGRELYVPWRLAQGEQLYRDIAYFNGPLSPYFNGLVFRLFGVGYWTLVCCNAVLLIGFCAMLWRTFKGALPRNADGLCATVFLLFGSVAFFFGQQVLCGNYNFLSPYSHEATHGLMLGFAALLLSRQGAQGRLRCFWIGLFLGLVFLTKVELFAASSISVAWLLLRSSGRKLLAPLLPSLFSGLLLPSVLALLLLSSQMPLAVAAKGVLGGWPYLVAGEASQLAFYRNILGFDAAGPNALGLLGATCIWLAMLLGASLLARKAPQAGWLALLLFLVSYFGWRAAGHGALAPAQWLARCLPLAGVLVLLASPLARKRIAHLDAKAPWSLFLGLTLFGLLLLGKMILQPRFAHYGFFLSLPASCALLLFSLGWLPALLGVPRRHILACVLGAYAAAGTSLLGISNEYFENKSLPLGSGADATSTDFRGQELSAALAVLLERIDPASELLVLPEGVGLNYLARRRTPTRMINFMPLELLLFGEQATLIELRKNPPGAVLLVHKDTTEYGYPYFGRDYGLAIYAWVRRNYHQTWSQSRGGDPLEPGTLFAVALYERNVK